jgi:hypothetical protein
MRLPLVAAVLSLAAAIPAEEGLLHSEYLGGYRFGVGIAPGINKHKVQDSLDPTGAPDPAQNGETSLTAKTGLDLTAGMFFNTSLDGGLGVAIVPQVFYRDVRGRGTAAGGVTVRDEMRAWGGRLAIGPALTMGPIALEVTPFIGAGAGWMETEYDVAGVSSRRGSNNGFFLDYGVLGTAFWRFESNFYLGASAGLDVFRCKMKSPATTTLDSQTITVSGDGLMASLLLGFWY